MEKTEQKAVVQREEVMGFRKYLCDRENAENTVKKYVAGGKLCRQQRQFHDRRAEPVPTLPWAGPIPRKAAAAAEKALPGEREGTDGGRILPPCRRGEETGEKASLPCA